MSVNDVRKLLVGMSLDELQQVAESVRAERERHADKARTNFGPGDKVVFVGRAGEQVEGVVEKVNRKNISVRQTNFSYPRRWTVHPSLLNKAKV